MHRLCLYILAALIFCGNTAGQRLDPPLQVGVAAPTVKFGKWLKGQPVSALKPGSVYVIGFWASWSRASLESIPHLSTLHKKLGSQVKFVGVNVLERDTKHRDALLKDILPTFAYPVALDSKEKNGCFASQWYHAAGLRKLPVVFVIDQKGNIAYIGHPMALDKQLPKIVAGKWSYDYAREAMLEDAALRLHEEGRAKAAYMAIFGKDYVKALTLANEMIADGDKTGFEVKVDTYLQQPNGQALLALTKDLMARHLFSGSVLKWKYQGLVMVGEAQKAAELGASILMHCKDWMSDATLAWDIVDPSLHYPSRDLKLALKAAKRAMIANPKDLTVCETMARVQYCLGNHAEAIRIQKDVISRTPKELRARKEKILREYQTGS